MIENIGSIDLNVGTESEEIIPISAGNARQFEAPEGGTYAGNYSLVFNGGSGRALLIFNTPQGSVDPSRENGGTRSDYTESLV